MPHLTTDDGVKLYYQEVGEGAPIVFVHEFAGGCRSWEHEQQIIHKGLAHLTANRAVLQRQFLS
jgi:pimeloyl-ACP methyl ester carboxylesterase